MASKRGIINICKELIGGYLVGRGKALSKVLGEVGSTSDLAKLTDYIVSHIRSMLCEHRAIPPKIVNKLVELANCKLKPRELRPDIFLKKEYKNFYVIRNTEYSSF